MVRPAFIFKTLTLSCGSSLTVVIYFTSEVGKSLQFAEITSYILTNWWEFLYRFGQNFIAWISLNILINNFTHILLFYINNFTYFSITKILLITIVSESCALNAFLCFCNKMITNAHKKWDFSRIYQYQPISDTIKISIQRAL